MTDKLVKLDPFDYPQAFFFNSVANYNLQNFEAAEKSALAAERLDTRHAFPKVSHILGMLLAMKKDYAGAAEHFKAYLKFAPTAEDAPKVRSQLAEVEKITAARAAPKSSNTRDSAAVPRANDAPWTVAAVRCYFRARRECRGWRNRSW